MSSVATAVELNDGSTVISGRTYADITHLDVESDGVGTAVSGTGVDVKRFYLGVTHDFDATWSVNLTTDFNYVSSDGNTQLYVKKAYVQARLSDALIGRLGSADMPWIPFVEDLYGFRFVENTLIDRLKFGTSADWGIHGRGTLLENRFSYAAAVVNGAGYKNPTRSNSMDFEARVGFVPINGLTLALGGYSGKLGEDIEGSVTTPRHTATRGNLLVAYVDGPWRLGAEYFQAKNWNQVTTPESDRAGGYSVWGSYYFRPDWGVFARGDAAKTSKDLNPDQKDRYYNAGLAYHPRENVDLALVYKYEKVEGGGSLETTNGTIGGLVDGKYNEFGLWVQVNF